MSKPRRGARLVATQSQPPPAVQAEQSSAVSKVIVPSRSDRLFQLRIKSIFLCLLAALTSGCGTPGIPLPPSLELPKSVTDLRAIRKGDKVHLTWTVPTRTTDRQPIRHFGATRICRALGEQMQSCSNPIAELPFAKAQKTPPPAQVYADILPDTTTAGLLSNATYAIEVTNDRGRSAGLSNQAQVPAAPTLAPPEKFSAQVAADGVTLTWTPITPPAAPDDLHYLIRIYRQQEDIHKNSIAGELPLDSAAASRFVDQNFEWEKKYSYRATVVTVIGRKPPTQLEGDDTPPVPVFTHDVFPPHVPSGLQAASASENAQSFIDLIWNPNTEPDLSGYNIFRNDGSGPAMKINAELVKLPAFRDTNVAAGKKYFYSVSSVDVRGNESQRSEEANETLPRK